MANDKPKTTPTSKADEPLTIKNGKVYRYPAKAVAPKPKGK